jgi:hypothetical protein
MQNIVLESTKNIVNNSKHVKVNKDNLITFAETLKNKKFKHWLDEIPFDLSKLNSYQKLHFLLVLNSISFCYWAEHNEKKWIIEYKGNKYDGAKGMIACIGRAIEEGIPILNPYFLRDIKIENLSYILRGNITIPLFEDRLNIVRELGKILIEKYNGNFENFINQNPLNVQNMLNKLLYDFPYFIDKHFFKDKEIHFHKRAQLLLSDIHEQHTPLKNTKELTACADYKLPYVFRRLNIFEYSQELENKINKTEPLDKGSVYELELRANLIHTIKEISKLINIEQRKINDYLWLLSQEEELKEKNNYKYHRVKTTDY